MRHKISEYDWGNIHTKTVELLWGKRKASDLSSSKGIKGAMPQHKKKLTDKEQSVPFKKAAQKLVGDSELNSTEGEKLLEKVVNNISVDCQSDNDSNAPLGGKNGSGDSWSV